METLRVIQWTTGKVGKLALRAILDDPRLQLAGVYAYSDDKAGVDAGKLCGRAPCGVLATRDVNTITAAMTAVCRQVESVSISESANCAVYESAETWLAMGMSLPEATPAVIATARNWLMSFYDAVQRMAAALDFTLDDMEFFIEFAKASQRVDLGWFCMEQGTNAAVRAGWNGKVNGRTVVQSKISWYLTKHLIEGWEFDDDQYHLVIKGEPEINTRIRFIAPKSCSNNDWDTMTALPAVNAAFNVAAARSGVLSLKDVGLPCAPAGIWLASTHERS